MPTLTVDGIEVTVPNGATVPQACELADKEVPRFSYHRARLSGEASDYAVAAA